MSNKVVKNLPDDFVIRMRNWARSNAGISHQHITMDYSRYLSASDGYSSSVPITMGDAIDVGRALGMLCPRDRQAVEIFWQYEGRSMEWFGHRAGCDRRTYEARLVAAHDQVRAELNRMHAMAVQYKVSASRGVDK